MSKDPSLAHGTVFVESERLPTPTPACCAHPGAPIISLRMEPPGANGQLAVAAVLHTGGLAIAGTQNDLTFDPDCISVVPKPNGRPDCYPNPLIFKPATAFSFRPINCSTRCNAIRSIVLSVDDVYPIPDGSVLYTCNLERRPNALGPACSLGVDQMILSDPWGMQVQASRHGPQYALTSAGQLVTVGGAAVTPLPEPSTAPEPTSSAPTTPLPFASATLAPISATPTPTIVPTPNTVTPVSTATSTFTPNLSGLPMDRNESLANEPGDRDGCQLAPGGSESALLLVAALLPYLLRRRD